MPNKISYKIEGVELQISIPIIQYLDSSMRIPLKTETKKTIANIVIDPDGDRCIIYDCYFVSLKQIVKNATDIDYYIGKMQEALDLLQTGIGVSATIQKMIKSHINHHGRIIDSDLMIIASACNRVTNAIIDIDNDCHELIEIGLMIAKENYQNQLFITVFDGDQPSICPASIWY